MDGDLEIYTRRCLERLEPLEPVPAGLPPRLRKLPDIKALFLDIYGTLLVSSSGDVEVADFSVPNVLASLEDCDVTVVAEDRESGALSVIAEFLASIRQAQDEARTAGVPYPEVDIVDVWRRALAHLSGRGVVTLPPAVDYEMMAVAFEMKSNPVWPMPGMRETVRRFSALGLKLGLLSNAQFFTPLIMNHFISGHIGRRETVPPFAPELTVYSYRERRGKPDPYLFRLAAERLRAVHVRPEQTLFVGNDMFKDIWGAAAVGFRTALFAGDGRSLRRREERTECRNLRPDCVITELSQLADTIQ